MKLSVVRLDDPMYCEYFMWGPSMGHLLSPPNYTGNLNVKSCEEKRSVSIENTSEVK